MLLGCIGDDFTGSSDLANTLAKSGMRVVQYSGVPDKSATDDVQAGVIALKSRSIPVPDAVAQSLDALAWLRQQGCQQFFFKYCSTFDSTRDGNIGPVAEALAKALNADRVIVCPAFPGAGRTVVHGHLFVDDTLLSESGMQNHPLTPMTDPDIRRWLGHQTQLKIGHVGLNTVADGAQAVRSALDAQNAAGMGLIVLDAMRDEDLFTIGAAAKGLPLVTGGSGVASGLPANLPGKRQSADASWTGQNGPCAILSGSCSNATRVQVEQHKIRHPFLEIDVAAVIEGRMNASEVKDWVLQQSGLPLVYSSAEPETVQAIQNRFGQETAANALETCFAELARKLVDSGVTRLISAGGETSGAVTEGLQLDYLEIGPEIDPGVPALRARENLVLALKSGNFGAPDFFEKAANTLGAAA
ncbi:MAG: 3-oxo-tetronate kinase [Granulosicoccus sp.]